MIIKMAAKQQPIHVSGQSTSSPPTTYLLPAGTRVYLSAPGVHFNPRYWPNPEQLDPSRWLSSDYDSTNKVATISATPGKETISDKRVATADKTRQMRGTLLTFSDGARACLGRKFAQAEYVAFLTALLHEYKVVLAPGEDPKAVERDIFLKSAGKVTLSPCRSTGLTLQKRFKSS